MFRERMSKREIDIQNLPHDRHSFTAEDTSYRQRGKHIQRFAEYLLRLVKLSLILGIHQADGQHHRRVKGMKTTQSAGVPLIWREVGVLEERLENG